MNFTVMRRLLLCTNFFEALCPAGVEEPLLSRGRLMQRLLSISQAAVFLVCPICTFTRGAA